MHRPHLETPGTLTIMLIYLGVSLVMCLPACVYLAARWPIS